MLRWIVIPTVLSLGAAASPPQAAPSVAILQNFSGDAEIASLQAYLSELGLESQVFNQQGLTFSALQGFDLIIWDDLGFQAGGISDNDVTVLSQAQAAGIPLYFIGDDLAYSTVNLTSTVSLWTGMLHLQSGGNGNGNGSVSISGLSHPVIQGPHGTAADFTLPTDMDDATATNTGELVLGTTGNYAVLLAFEDPDAGIRSVTQNFMAFNGGTPASVVERKKVFKNSVEWLLQIAPVISYWPFDGTSEDASAADKDLSLFGGVSFAPGLFGQALNLTNDPDKFARRSEDDPEFDFVVADFTLQVWVYFTSTSDEQTLIEKWVGAGGPGWTLTKQAANNLRLDASPALVLDSAPLAIAPSQWHHVIVRRNSSAVQIFFDGTPVATGSTALAISNVSVPLLVGKRNEQDGRDFPVKGRIDEVAIWGAALTDERIAQLYNGGAGTAVIPSETDPPAAAPTAFTSFASTSAEKKDTILPCAAGSASGPGFLMTLFLLGALTAGRVLQKPLKRRDP